MGFIEINPLAVKQGKIRTPDNKNNASRNIDRFLQKLTPSMRQDVESYVDFMVDDKRSVDRQTIRELVEEVKHLTLKVEGIHGFNEFVSGSNKSGSKNRKDAESTSKALWSFMYGAICMLI